MASWEIRERKENMEVSSFAGKINERSGRKGLEGRFF